MKTFLLLLALAVQQDEVMQLERERLAASRETRPYMDMVAVQAVHSDGTPARGAISCDGLWQKYDEIPTGGWGLPFVTDSRGVTVFNPWIGQYDDAEMHCYATDTHGHSGEASWEMPASHAEIIVK